MNTLQKPGEMAITDSLGTIIDSYINSLDAKPTTATTYRKALNQFQKWIIASNLTAISRGDLLNYKRYLTGRHTAATVSSYIAAIKGFYKWLEAEKISPNIAAGIKGAKTPRGFRKDTLTPYQAKKVLQNIDRGTLDGMRNYALFNLLLRTGIRTIEAQRADIEDIRQEAGQALLYIQGKGRDSKDEFIILTAATLEPIRNYIAARGAKQGAIFVSNSKRNHGERLSVRSISRIIKTALREAGIDSNRITAHSLRHSAITFSLLGGASIQEAQSLARHTSILTTTIYAHNINRIASAPEAKIDRFLDAVEDIGEKEPG